MKISLILLLVSMGTIYASAYSQNRDITLDVKNISLKEVIKQIERQSDYTFFYNEDYIDLSQLVSLTANKKDIEVIVDEDSLSEDNERHEDYRERECDEIVI